LQFSNTHQSSKSTRTIRFDILQFALLLVFGFYVFVGIQAWWVDNHNDFGEYFTQAELWSRGHFVFSGGSDKLLALIELVPIYLLPRNFYACYMLLKFVVILALWGAVFAFINSKAKLLPPRRQRSAACLVFLLHPVFLLSATTVDPSVIFTATLFLFLSFYDRPIISVILAILCLYSRKEGLIVLPLFAALAVFSDNGLRWRVAKSAMAASSIFLVLKAAEIALSGPTEEYNIAIAAVGRSAGRFVIDSIFVLISPMVIGAHIFPQYVVFALVLIGLSVTLLRRKYIGLNGTLFLHSCLIAGLFWSLDVKIEKILVSAASTLSWYPNTLTVDLQQPHVYGWPRYYLVDYPVASLSAVAGAQVVWRAIEHLFGRLGAYVFISKSASKATYCMIISVLFAVTYAQGYGDLIISRKYFFPNNLEPLNAAGMAIRGQREADDDAVLFDGFCDATQGSLASEFSVYSGVLRKYLRVCVGSNEFGSNPEAPDASERFLATEKADSINVRQPGRFLMSSEQVDQLGSDRRVFMKDYVVDRAETMAEAANGQFDQLFSLQLAALAKAKVRFVVTTRKDVRLEWLKSIGQFGPYTVHVVDSAN
jgi:hypothetical protein